MEDRPSPGSVNVLQVHTCQQCAARLLLPCARVVRLVNTPPLPTTLQPALTVLFVSLVHIWILHALLPQILPAIRALMATTIRMSQELLVAASVARVLLANTAQVCALLHQTQYVLPVFLVSRVLVHMQPLLSVLPGVSVQGAPLHPACAALEDIALPDLAQIIRVLLDPFAAVLALFLFVLRGLTALFDPLHKFHALWASFVQGIHPLPLNAWQASAVLILQPRSYAA